MAELFQPEQPRGGNNRKCAACVAGAGTTRSAVAACVNGRGKAHTLPSAARGAAHGQTRPRLYRGPRLCARGRRSQAGALRMFVAARQTLVAKTFQTV